MGWYSDDAPGHEGYLVGLLRTDPRDESAWRDLTHDDPALPQVDAFQAVCTCGWRSPRFRAPLGTKFDAGFWLPEVHEDLEDLLRDVWTLHWRVPDALAGRALVRVPRGAPPFSRDSENASRGGSLVLADEPGGLRHFLLGKPVHAADALELLLADGRWILGRYENQRGQDFLRALFYFDVPCATSAPDWAPQAPGSHTALEGRVELGSRAILRWPSRR